MEPTIYKPGAYKSPGIYNGDGGIYKGRGVYNDGMGGGSEYIYLTDFSGLNFDTGEDQNFIWTFTRGKDLLEKGVFNILGENINALKFNVGNNTPQIDFDKTQIQEDIFTIELDFYCPTSSYGSASGGLEYVGVAPYINLYSSGWGIGLKKINLSSIQTYNGFAQNSDKYFANWYQRIDNTRIITGGMSIDRNTKRCGLFLFDKKGISGISGNLNVALDIYFDTQGYPFYVTRFAISKGFKFDELE